MRLGYFGGPGCGHYPSAMTVDLFALLCVLAITSCSAMEGKYKKLGMVLVVRCWECAPRRAGFGMLCAVALSLCVCVWPALPAGIQGVVIHVDRSRLPRLLLLFRREETLNVPHGSLSCPKNLLFSLFSLLVPGCAAGAQDRTGQEDSPLYIVLF